MKVVRKQLKDKGLDNRKIRFLLNLSQEYQLTTDVEHLFEKLPQKIHDNLGFKRVIFFRLQPGKAVLTPVASINVDERHLENFKISLYRSDSLFTRVFLGMQPFIFKNKEDKQSITDFDQRLLEGLPYQSFMLVPLKKGGDLQECWNFKQDKKEECLIFNSSMVNNQQLDKKYVPPAVEQQKKKIEACLDCDLFPGVGMLWVDFGPKTTAIDNESQHFLITLSNLVEQTVEKIELKKMLQHNMEELEISNKLLVSRQNEIKRTGDNVMFSDNEWLAVTQVLQEISGVIDLPEMAKITFLKLADHLNISRMLLFLTDTENSYLEPVAGWGFPQQNHSSPEGFLSRIGKFKLAKNSKNVLVRSYLKEFAFHCCRKDLHALIPKDISELLELDDFAVVPLSSKERVLGVMLVDKKGKTEGLDMVDLRFLSYYLSHISMGIEKAQLYQMTYIRKEELESANQALLIQKQELEETYRKLEQSNQDILGLQKRDEIILDSIADGLFTVDNNWQITAFNPAAEDLIGIKAEEAIGQLCKEVIHGAMCDKKCSLRRTISTGETIVNEESTVVNKRGETLTILVSTAALRDEAGDSVGGVETFKDVSEMKRISVELKRANRELKKMDEMKSNFIGVLSHELRTPLTSIKGYNRLLASGKIVDLNEKAVNFLNIIDRQSSRLTNMIDELLDLTIIESGEMKIIKLETDYHEVVKRVVDAMHTTVMEKKIHLDFEVPVIQGFCADGEKLEHVLSNLINNAIKFTPEDGEIKVIVEDHGDFVETKVTDNGIGMTPETRDKIFTKFYQVEGKSKSQKAGIGLGLSIVKYIVEAHNGQIWVESEVGKGSSFIFSIPKK